MLVAAHQKNQPTPDSILVVDDAPGVCALIALTLSDLPYRILTAHSVRGARALLTAQVRAVVTDYNLPDGNGLEIIEAARLMKPSLPLLMMSGSAVDAGNVEFILKPFDTDEFFDRVRCMVEC